MQGVGKASRDGRLPCAHVVRVKPPYLVYVVLTGESPPSPRRGGPDCR